MLSLKSKRAFLFTSSGKGILVTMEGRSSKTNSSDENQELYSAFFSAIHASFSMMTDDLKGGIQLQLSNTIKNFIVFFIASITILCSTLYLLHFTCREIFQLLALDQKYTLPFLAFFLLSVALFILKRNDSQSQTIKRKMRKKDLKAIAHFKSRVLNIISHAHTIISDPISTIKSYSSNIFQTLDLSKITKNHVTYLLIILGGTLYLSRKYIAKNLFSDTSVSSFRNASSDSSNKLEANENKQAFVKDTLQNLLLALSSMLLKEFISELFSTNSDQTSKKSQRNKSTTQNQNKQNEEDSSKNYTERNNSTEMLFH